MPRPSKGECVPVLVRVPRSLLEIVDETVESMNASRGILPVTTRTDLLVKAIESWVTLEVGS